MKSLKFKILMVTLFFLFHTFFLRYKSVDASDVNPPATPSAARISNRTDPVINAPKKLQIIEIDNQALYHPAELDAPVFNSGCGLTYPTWKGEGDLYKTISKYSRIAYNRFTWNKLEPREGEYKFDFLRNWILKWKARGFKVAFGVMSTSVKEQATPPWVFKTGVPGVSHMQGKQTDPVYWHQAYLEKHENFVKAMGKALRDIDGIEFIDMRGIGVWGEMHFGTNIEGMWTNDELIQNGYSGIAYFEAYKKMIDSYKDAFPDIRLFLNISPNHDNIVAYAAEQGINLRYDGLKLAGPFTTGSASRYFKKYGYPRVISNPSDSEETPGYPGPESGEIAGNWKVSSGMTLSTTSNGEIKLSGKQKDAWNYAYFTPSSLSLKFDQIYRIEGWIKVESTSNELSPPYFVFQAHDENGKFIKNHPTNRYDMSAINKWQKISGLFSTDRVEKKGILSIEKGKKIPISTVFYVKDFRLNKMDENFPYKSPEDLEGLSANGVHCLYEFRNMESDNFKVKNILDFALSEPVSYINLNYFVSGKKFNESELETIKRAAQNIGYRLFLNQIKIPKLSSYSPNKKLTLPIEETWTNKGASPCYENYKIRYILTDNADRDILTFDKYPEVPVWKWYPRKNIRTRTIVVIPPDMKDGIYTLKIGMVDALKSKHIKLPIKNIDASGCYKMFDIKISTRKNLRHITPILK